MARLAGETLFRADMEFLGDRVTTWDDLHWELKDRYEAMADEINESREESE